MDGHSHHIAYFIWLLSDPAIESVYSEMGALASDAPVEDTGVTLIRTAGGDRRDLRLEPAARTERAERAVLQGVGRDLRHQGHDPHPPHRATLAAGLRPGRWRSTRRSAVAGSPRASSGSRIDERGYSAHFNADEDPWVGEHRHFVACIRDGGPVVSDGRFGRRVHEVTAGGLRVGPGGAGRSGLDAALAGSGADEARHRWAVADGPQRESTPRRSGASARWDSAGPRSSSSSPPAEISTERAARDRADFAGRRSRRRRVRPVSDVRSSIRTKAYARRTSQTLRDACRVARAPSAARPSSPGSGSLNPAGSGCRTLTTAA